MERNVNRDKSDTLFKTFKDPETLLYPAPYMDYPAAFPYPPVLLRPSFIPILQKGHFFKNILPTQ